MKSLFERRINSLMDRYNNFSSLSASDVEDLIAAKVLEMPIKHIPSLERFDVKRELVTMVAKYHESQDEMLGGQILEKLTELMFESMEHEIEQEWDDRKIHEADLMEETRKEHATNVYYDNLQRI